MSDNKQSYYMSSDSSEYDSDSSYSSDASDASGESFSSLAADLGSLCRHLEELGIGVEDMATSVQSMEAPLSRVAVSTFVQPRVLESAPFRQQRFRWRPEAAAALGVGVEVATFAEICEVLRRHVLEHCAATEDGKIELSDTLATLLGSSAHMSFLDLLGHMRCFVC
jgi:hypothetical protein